VAGMEVMVSRLKHWMDLPGEAESQSTDLMFVIWSHEHCRFWAPHSRGYTWILSHAGRYTRAEAERICRNANEHQPADEEPNETMLLAPECLAVAAVNRAGGGE